MSDETLAQLRRERAAVARRAKTAEKERDRSDAALRDAAAGIEAMRAELAALRTEAARAVEGFEERLREAVRDEVGRAVRALLADEQTRSVDAALMDEVARARDEGRAAASTASGVEEEKPWAVPPASAGWLL